ncbi:MAG: hypothetical protein ACE5JG_00225 [Planctomycetota bacterium]
MKAGGAAADIYQRFEREVRAPGRRLLLDAFLPEPDRIPSAVAPPPPPPTAEAAARGMTLSERLEAEVPQPEPRPKPRPMKGAASRKKAATRPRTLQEEIEEFMNRDGAPSAAAEDFASPADTDADPEPDPQR